ncbi:MAG: hypothetical protein AB1489_20125 [Acidobacteriota bacterium]
MDKKGSHWFYTRQKYSVHEFMLDEIWQPLLYAIDVSCGSWQQALSVRRAVEHKGKAAVAGLRGLVQVQAIARMIGLAYQAAYQNINQPLPDPEVIEEQILSAVEMIWELPDGWVPVIALLEQEVDKEQMMGQGGA